MARCSIHDSSTGKFDVNIDSRTRRTPQGLGGGRTVIANLVEYEKAQEEIRLLEDRLKRLQESNPVGSRGFTKAGVRKMIARLHEELAVFEGSEEARHPSPD
jgi:hypothetical protein